MSSVITSNVTSGFIDLATFDEIEKYMYGGPDATAYFVRETRKSTWFTQVPVALAKNAGTAAFGQDWSVTISRAGDYLLQTWLRLELNPVTVQQGTINYIRWTRNFMHNLIKDCTITFNDLVAARFDSYFLDFWTAFTVPASKKVGYDTMIGNISSLILPNSSLPGAILNLPLPFFYTRDSGVALPTAALPYNDMKINFSFRDWNELLVGGNYSALGSTVSATQLTSVPIMKNVYVWANYAIVSNDERKRMACAPRDILIEQVQTAPKQTFSPLISRNPTFDIRFSHAVKVLFFSVRNKTVASDWSNYTTQSYQNNGGTDVNNTISFFNGVDNISSASLIYENTARLASMPYEYYSYVNPYYNAPAIPFVYDYNQGLIPLTGYHSYSYSLDFNCLDPMGSTNYGKLTNVSIIPNSSDQAFITAGNTGGGDYYNRNQTFEFLLTCVNNNIIRISGGALGFPVL